MSRKKIISFLSLLFISVIYTSVAVSYSSLSEVQTNTTALMQPYCPPVPACVYSHPACEIAQPVCFSFKPPPEVLIGGKM